MAALLYYQNVRGLRTKTKEFFSNLLNYKAQFFCFTETWLNSDFHSNEYISNNFISHRRDRNYESTGTTRGGGCWILHKPTIDSVRRYDFETNLDFLEDIWIQVKLEGTNNFLYICNVYITPMPSNTHLYVAFSEKLKDNLALMNPSDRILIVGDFNVSMIKWTVDDSGILVPSLNVNSTNAIEVLNLISYGNFEQFNQVYYDEDGTEILDLVLSSDPHRAIKVTKADSFLVSPDMYHPPLEIEVDIRLKYLPVVNHRKYKFRQANYEAICDELDNIDWRFIDSLSFTLAILQFYSIVNGIIHKHTPIYGRKSKYPFWFDFDLRDKLKKKDKARSKWKKTNLDNDYQIFSDLRRECKTKTEQCYNNYINNLQANIKTNIKLFWAFTKKKKKTNSYPSSFKHDNVIVSSPKEICELFATYFKSTFNNRSSDRSININNTVHSNTVQSFYITPTDVESIITKIDLNKNGGPDGIPNFFLRQTCKQISIPLSMIFNRSLRSAIYPEEFKTSFVTPIFKKGDESLVSNYRPICMSNSIAIVFEKIVNLHLMSVVESQITPKQHGFMRNKSTNTNLIEYVSYVSSALDERSEVHAVYTDFSKAFDTVDHEILLSKLLNFGIDLKLVNWFRSYLTNRKMYVTFNGDESTTFVPTSGVPQGSVLGPLLFNIFINDLCRILKCEFLLFADDLKIYIKFRTQEDAIRLQNDIDKLYEWSVINKLLLNIEKCHVVIFSNKIVPSQQLYRINTLPLAQRSSVNDLGVIFDDKLKFDEHVNSIVKKSNSMLGFIARTTTDFQNQACLKYLYNALVRSRLEYNTSVWNPYQSNHKGIIERVQRKYTRIVFFKMRHEPQSYKERLKTLDMLELEMRREYFDACLLHKLVHNRDYCSHSRPYFRVGRQSNRMNIQFNPYPSNNDYGRLRNPVNRAQLLYDRRFKTTNILNPNYNNFKVKLMSCFN